MSPSTGDAAVEAFRACTDALRARNGVVADLVQLPVDQRHRDSDPGPTWPHGAELILDGHRYRRQDINAHLERVFAAADLVRVGDRNVPATDTPYSADNRDL